MYIAQKAKLLSILYMTNVNAIFNLIYNKSRNYGCILPVIFYRGTHVAFEAVYSR